MLEIDTQIDIFSSRMWFLAFCLFMNTHSGDLPIQFEVRPADIPFKFCYLTCEWNPTRHNSLQGFSVHAMSFLSLSFPESYNLSSFKSKPNEFDIFIYLSFYLDVKGRHWTLRSFVLIEQCPGPSSQFDHTL